MDRSADPTPKPISRVSQPTTAVDETTRFRAQQLQPTEAPQSVSRKSDECQARPTQGPEASAGRQPTGQVRCPLPGAELRPSRNRSSYHTSFLVEKKETSRASAIGHSEPCRTFNSNGIPTMHRPPNSAGYSFGCCHSGHNFNSPVYKMKLRFSPTQTARQSPKTIATPVSRKCAFSDLCGTMSRNRESIFKQLPKLAMMSK